MWGKTSWCKNPVVPTQLMNSSFHESSEQSPAGTAAPQSLSLSLFSTLHHPRSVMGTVTSDLSHVGSLIWSGGLNCCSHYLTSGQVECDRCGIIRNAHHCQHAAATALTALHDPPVSSSSTPAAADVDATPQPQDTNCCGKQPGNNNETKTTRSGGDFRLTQPQRHTTNNNTQITTNIGLRWTWTVSEWLHEFYGTLQHWCQFYIFFSSVEFCFFQIDFCLCW